jgi:PAS domain S-box-containing protein
VTRSRDTRARTGDVRSENDPITGRGAARVCIVVAQPHPDALPERGAALDSTGPLERLGPGARLLRVHDASACLARCQSETPDLVVVDRALAGEADRILDRQGRQGPPIVVVDAQGSDERALDAFRRGAADCIAAGPDYAEVLPVVALEQIRHWRTLCERGSAERRIRDLEHANENIIQNMNSALLVVDLDGRIASCNPPAEHILGRRAAELRGTQVLDWFTEVGTDEGLVARTLGEEVSFKGAESSITRPDGTVIPIGVSASPMFGADGEKLGAVAIFQDLSEMNQLRGQVLQSEKMASIGQLAAGVAHEINNPMGFIHANLFQMAEYVGDLHRVWTEVDGLQQAVARGDDEGARAAAGKLAEAAREADVAFVLEDLAKAIRESQEGSERIRHIVQDLRDFSHHDTGERVVADLNQCLDSTANIVWPMMKHLAVLEKAYGDLPEIYCYPMQLKQVFMNLLVNAFQSIEERGPEAGPGHIRLQSMALESEIEILVSDTGMGIDKENLDRIFDPFFTTKKVGTGTGLGLSMCYNIVRRHGGMLTVESQVGEGTTFRLLLPRVEDEEAEKHGSGG